MGFYLDWCPRATNAVEVVVKSGTFGLPTDLIKHELQRLECQFDQINRLQQLQVNYYFRNDGIFLFYFDENIIDEDENFSREEIILATVIAYHIKERIGHTHYCHRITRKKPGRGELRNNRPFLSTTSIKVVITDRNIDLIKLLQSSESLSSLQAVTPASDSEKLKALLLLRAMYSKIFDEAFNLEKDIKTNLFTFNLPNIKWLKRQVGKERVNISKFIVSWKASAVLYCFFVLVAFLFFLYSGEVITQNEKHYLIDKKEMPKALLNYFVILFTLLPMYIIYLFIADVAIKRRKVIRIFYIASRWLMYGEIYNKIIHKIYANSKDPYIEPISFEYASSILNNKIDFEKLKRTRTISTFIALLICTVDPFQEYLAEGIVNQDIIQLFINFFSELIALLK